MWFRFGEEVPTNAAADDDVFKMFFGTLATFGRALAQAVTDNDTKVAELAKAAKIQEDAARRRNDRDAKGKQILDAQSGKEGQGVVEATEASTGLSSGPSTRAKKENIFGNYHVNQQASAESVVAEFKLKMQAKTRRPSVFNTGK